MTWLVLSFDFEPSNGCHTVKAAYIQYVQRNVNIYPDKTSEVSPHLSNFGMELKHNSQR